MSRGLFFFGAGAALIWTSASACMATPGTTGGGGFGGSGAVTSSASSTGDFGGGFTTSTGGGAGGSGTGCVGTSTKAEPAPLDIFVMLDQSGSMLQDAGNNLSRWKTVQSALTAFVKQPGTVGIGMGLQFFGQPQPLVPGCITQSCVKDADCGNGCAVCMPQGLCQGPFNPDIDSCDAVDCAWAEVPIHEVDPQGRRQGAWPAERRRLVPRRRPGADVDPALRRDLRDGVERPHGRGRRRPRLRHDREVRTGSSVLSDRPRAQSLAGIRRPASSLVSGGSAPSRCRK